ncbi:unnamed protein product [Linum trigynum]|uniref:Uncharacterized protein n=1 Tax=Linum trigynum TaxID=586398 RepID=A0AAV2E452_9ROSI
MLSNALAETSTMAPALTPSGRPPNTESTITALMATDEPTTTSMTSDSSPMAVETNLPKADCIVPNATTRPPTSYARALAGVEPHGAQAAQKWTPVGENDLVPGQINGEPSLSIFAGFKGRLCAPLQKTLVERLLGLRILLSTSRTMETHRGAGDHGFG